jgi:N6-adenosine-specific RNA methylase IME4
VVQSSSGSGLCLDHPIIAQRTLALRDLSANKILRVAGLLEVLEPFGFGLKIVERGIPHDRSATRHFYVCQLTLTRRVKCVADWRRLCGPVIWVCGFALPIGAPYTSAKSKSQQQSAVTCHFVFVSYLTKSFCIVQAARAEPEKYGKLVEDMDRTHRVDGVFKRLRVAQQAEGIRRETPSLPGNGPYRVIVADPPWSYSLRAADASHRGITPYPEMSIEQICAVDIASIAHDDCVLWLWTTNAHMRGAFDVLDAWGFEQKTILTWAKDRMGMGDWLRGQTEHCIMAVRGKPTVVLTNQTTLLHGPVREHSQKPDEFYALVETLCPAPRYAYLFSREEREGWDMHGDELPKAPNRQYVLPVTS